MTTRPDARAAIDALQRHEAWALIRRSTRVGGKDTVGLVGGRRWVAESITDVPLETGTPEPGRTCDRLLAVPFRQVAERGFEAHDDGTPLVVVDVVEELELSVAEVLEAIPDTGVELADRGGFDIDDDAYAKVVDAIIQDEIGQGEGANLVVGRRYRAVVADWDATKARSIMATVLQQHPDLCGGVGFWDVMDVGTGAAIREANKKVYWITQGGGNQAACDNLNKDLYSEVVSYDVPAQARDIANIIQTLFQNKPKPGATKTTLFSPLTFINKENMKPGACWTLETKK